MSMTLAEIVGSARAELGLFPISPSVVSSGAEIDQQMFYLVNQLGTELMQNGNWTALQSEHIITTETIIQTTGDLVDGSGVISNIAAGTSLLAATTWGVTGNGIVTSARIASIDSPTQVTLTELATDTAAGVALTFAKDTYPLPDDFQGFISDTWWDRTNRWQLLGPSSPQADQFLRSGIVTTTPRRSWRQIGRLANAWRAWPPPGTTDPRMTWEYEYNSSYWATDVNGVGKVRFSADTDTCVFPDAVMIAGLKMRFFDAKGMDTTVLRATYERLLASARGSDGGASKLSMTGAKSGFHLLDYWNIPDGNFPAQS